MPRREIIVVNSTGSNATFGREMNFIVGGNILGLGLTIENLLVTYYLRRAKVSQMDTMLQHARMFGYRAALMPFTRVIPTRASRAPLPQHPHGRAEPEGPALGSGAAREDPGAGRGRLARDAAVGSRHGLDRGLHPRAAHLPGPADGVRERAPSAREGRGRDTSTSRGNVAMLLLKEKRDTHLVPVAFAQVREGDVVLLKIVGSPQHLALLTDYPMQGELGMVHAYAPARKVVEHRYDALWRRETYAAYRLPMLCAKK